MLSYHPCIKTPCTDGVINKQRKSWEEPMAESWAKEIQKKFKRNLINFCKDTKANVEFLISSCPKSTQSLEEIQPNLEASNWASDRVAEYKVCHSTSCVYRRSDPLAFVSNIQIYKNLSADLIPESSPIITRSVIHNRRT